MFYLRHFHFVTDVTEKFLKILQILSFDPR